MSTDKTLIIRGGLVSFNAGEVDTDDAEAIAALSGALDVAPVDDKPKKKPAKEPEQAAE